MLTLKVIYNQRYQDAMAMTHSEMIEVTGVSIGDMDFRDIRGYGITVYGIKVEGKEIRNAKMYRYKKSDDDTTEVTKKYDEVRTSGMITEGSIVTAVSSISGKETWNLKTPLDVDVCCRQLEVLAALENIKE